MPAYLIGRRLWSRISSLWKPTRETSAVPARYRSSAGIAYVSSRCAGNMPVPISAPSRTSDGTLTSVKSLPTSTSRA